MNKGNILFLGCGQAGNQILSEILKKNKRYGGVFINSNYTDLDGLYGVADNLHNVIIFDGLNGAGRNRDVAKGYLKDQLPLVTDKVLDYQTRNIINIICSSDGGTGSGIVPNLIRVLKTLTNKTINLIFVLPNYETANILSLSNAVDFWNDIFMPQTDKRGNTFKIEDMLNDIKVIDNSKLNGDYKAINKRIADDIDMAYSIVGKDIEGNIDVADSETVNLQKGFSTILSLPQGMNSTDAIKTAMKDSIFISNLDTTCTYAAISCKKNEYNKNTLAKELKVTREIYSTYNEKFNVIVQSGIKPIPLYAIERINNRKNTLENQIKHVEDEDKFIRVDKSNTVDETNKVNHEDPILYTQDNIDDILEDLADLI